MADGAVAELFREALQELRGHQADLSRPGGGVGRDRQLAAVERLWLGVQRQLGAHDVHPVAEDGADRGLLAPAARRQQAADGGGQGLRVVPPGPGRPGRGRGAGESQAPSFWILGLIPLARGARTLSPSPCVFDRSFPASLSSSSP